MSYKKFFLKTLGVTQGLLLKQSNIVEKKDMEIFAPIIAVFKAVISSICNYIHYRKESKKWNSLECDTISNAYSDLVRIQGNFSKLNENAYIERFNRTFRHEVLNAYLFDSL